MNELTRIACGRAQLCTTHPLLESLRCFPNTFECTFYIPMAQSTPESTKSIGDKGESLACDYLSKRGYSLIEKNWKYFRFEIDLIMEKEGEIVFVEVKTRFSDTYGEPWEAVNRGKRQRICTSADAYLRDKKCTLEPRFDIISIIKNGERVQIQHIESAFRPEA